MPRLRSIIGTLFLAGIVLFAFLIWAASSMEHREPTAAAADYAVAETPTAAISQPHDDGNGIAVDPDSIPKSAVVEDPSKQFSSASNGSNSMPEIHNSPDTECNNSGAQCSDDEFADALKGVKQQWNLAPDWLRTDCASNHMLPSMEHCILSNTLAWLNAHPDGKAPWLAPNGANEHP